jgi:GDP-L-fucose synthase
MPANSYGVNDNYDKNTSHFLPALIRKIIYAKKNNKKSITLWGTGKPKRELVFSEDLACATIYFLNKRTKETLINIGTNVEKSIEDYAKYLMKLMDIKLSIRYIKRNLDGTFEKKLDTSLASRYGWNAKTSLSKGLMIAIKDFKSRKIT